MGSWRDKLRSPHPMWEHLVQVPASPYFWFILLLMHLGRGARSCHSPGSSGYNSWLPAWAYPTLAFVGIWGVNWQMEELSFSFLPSLRFKWIDLKQNQVSVTAACKKQEIKAESSPQRWPSQPGGNASHIQGHRTQSQRFRTPDARLVSTRACCQEKEPLSGNEPLHLLPLNIYRL